ncbi:MAG: helix-turn-helix domain-containing protein [Burkholderiales bacterium]|jgi:IclR family pca regulon transcriptional regulator|nr:helix-turn-helix domain-containing protein [Burkholderiales bacterium]
MDISETDQGTDMLAPTDKRSDFVAALARGLSVIEAFSADTPEMTLSEVAARANLSPATARRALITLVELGYVGAVGKRFVLRPKVLGLGSAFLNSMHIRELAQPYLQEIADRFKDSASMAILDGDSVMYIAHVPSKRRIRYNGSVGYRSPAYGTSLGLALMAYREPAFIDAWLAKAPFPAYTSKTIHTADGLRDALMRVREHGYATAEEQLEYGVVAISVPIRDGTGRVVASINCSSELERNDLQTLVDSRLEPLRATAEQIEQALQRFPALGRSLALD